MSLNTCAAIASGALQVAFMNFTQKAAQRYGKESGDILRRAIDRKNWSKKQVSEWEDAANAFERNRASMLENDLSKSQASLKEFLDDNNELPLETADLLQQSLNNQYVKKLKEMHKSLELDKELLGMLKRNEPSSIGWGTFSRKREADMRLKSVIRKMLLRGEEEAEAQSFGMHARIGLLTELIGKSAKNATPKNLKKVRSWMSKLVEDPEYLVADLMRRKKWDDATARKNLAEGIAAGHSTEDPVVDIFAKLLKEVRLTRQKTLADMDELVDDPLEHLHFRPDRTRIEQVLRNEDEFISELSRVVDWESMFPNHNFTGEVKRIFQENYLHAWSKNVLDIDIAPSANRKALKPEILDLFAETKLRVREGEELAAFQLMGNPADNYAISVYRHYTGGVNQAARRFKLGANLQFQKNNMEELIRHHPGWRKYLEDPTKSKNLKSYLDEAFGPVMVKQKAPYDEETVMLNAIIESVNMGISFSLTSASTLRNLIFDQGIWQSLVDSFSPWGKGRLGIPLTALLGALEKVGLRNPFLFVKGMLQGIPYSYRYVRNLEQKQSKALEALAVQGHAIRLSRFHLNAGILKHVNAQRAYSAGQSLSKKGIRGIEKAGRFSHWMSGSQIFDEQVRIRGLAELGGMMEEGLKKNYDKLDADFQYELGRFGIGADEWAAYQKSNRFKLDGLIGARNIGPYVDYEKMWTGVSEDVIKKASIAGESLDRTKKRLVTNWRLFMRELQTERNPRPTKKSDILRVYEETHPGRFGLLRHLTRFFNININQWEGGMERMAVASGLSKEANGMWGIGLGAILQAAAHPRGWSPLGNLIFFGLSGSVVGLWVDDLTRGYYPRAITPETMMDAFRYSGMLGSLNFFTESFSIMDAYRFGWTIPREGFEAAIGSEKYDEEQLKNATYRAATRFITPLSFFYTRLLTKQFLRDQIMELGRSPGLEVYDSRIGREPFVGD